MHRRYQFVQVDVFTTQAFGGNQLAVFTDARGLSDAEMQQLTREMNFSESSFVLPAALDSAAYRVRIFTPAQELPMAGHPTIGTAWVLAAHGGLALASNDAASIILELGIGPVAVEIDMRDGKPEFVWMTQRSPQFGRIFDQRERLMAALGLSEADLHAGLPVQVVSTGVPFLIVPLASLAAAQRCHANQSALAALFADDTALPVYVFSRESSDTTCVAHARMFSPHVFDIAEDPATGSAAAPLGAYMAHYGLLGPAGSGRFMIEQGLEMGRPSRIHLDLESAFGSLARLRIGGQAVIVGQGEIFWNDR